MKKKKRRRSTSASKDTSRASVDEMLDYFHKEMNPGEPPLTDYQRRIMTILAEKLLESEPNIKTPFHFLCYMNDYTREVGDHTPWEPEED